MKVKHLLILLLLVMALPILSFKTEHKDPDGYYVYFTTYSKHTRNDKPTRYISTIVRISDYSNRYGNPALDVKRKFQKRFISKILDEYEEEVHLQDIQPVFVAAHQDFEDFENDWIKDKKSPKHNSLLLEL